MAQFLYFKGGHPRSSAAEALLITATIAMPIVTPAAHIVAKWSLKTLEKSSLNRQKRLSQRRAETFSSFYTIF